MDQVGNGAGTWKEEMSVTGVDHGSNGGKRLAGQSRQRHRWIKKGSEDQQTSASESVRAAGLQTKNPGQRLSSKM